MRWTTSTAGSASIASKLGYGAGSPAARAFSAARSGLEPTMPATSIPSRRSASTWTTPMKPVPTTAALISRMSLTPPPPPTVVYTAGAASLFRRPTGCQPAARRGARRSKRVTAATIAASHASATTARAPYAAPLSHAAPPRSSRRSTSLSSRNVRSKRGSAAHLACRDAGIAREVDGHGEDRGVGVQPDHRLPVAVDRQRLGRAVDARGPLAQLDETAAAALPRHRVQPLGIGGRLRRIDPHRGHDLALGRWADLVEHDRRAQRRTGARCAGAARCSRR